MHKCFMKGLSMSQLFFEKYANFDRINEPVRVSIPFEKGAVTNLDNLQIYNDKGIAPLQHRALGFWGDGSVKWAKVDFMVDLPANKSTRYNYDFNGKKQDSPFKLKQAEDILIIENGAVSLALGNAAGKTPFENFALGDFSLNKIDGPYMLDDAGKKHTAALTGPWQVEEDGAVMLKLNAKGKHKSPDNTNYMDFILSVSVYANTPWFEVGYRIINRLEPEFCFVKKIALDFHFAEPGESRHLATSNYLSDIRTETGEKDLRFMIDADYLCFDGNEQTPETFYGTFFADWNSKNGGICATLYQAYQNFPKALTVGKDFMSVEILPEEYGQIKYYRGMAKNHTLFLHLHGADADIMGLNKRSLMLQSMDKPVLPAEVYEKSGCFPNFFPQNKWMPFETQLLNIADQRGKAYGLLHWGDCPDSGYSAQGRGGGDHVWTNNEYDMPFAAIQLFARCGKRRMLDYALVSGAHWVDIDVIHHSDDPLRLGGQVEHSKDHVTGPVEISHQWVEGLFAYYYQTGDQFAYDTVIGIGNNIKRHLSQPRFQKKGGVNARETGWALRALTALYLETNDESWLEQAEFIVSHFTVWKETFGGWFAPYTDHTTVRVPFMISIAVASLMRYYRVRPSVEIKTMITEAMDDLIENALLENGMFYYKELPSLARPGGNPILLEALACAYELTGDEKYLEAGIPLFLQKMKPSGAGAGKKEKIQDGVLMAGTGPKGFAQSFYPLAYYYFHLCKTKLLKTVM